MRLTRRFYPWLVLFLLLLLMLYAAQARAAAQESLARFALILLPSLLPFSVAANLLILTGGPFAQLLQKPLARLGLPASAAGPLLAGLLGGYPVGLQALSTLYQQGGIQTKSAIALSRLCNNAGPAFLLGAVGLSMFGSLSVGLLLWGIQLLSLLLCALLFARSQAGSHANEVPLRPMSIYAALPHAVRRSSTALLVVCGYVVFFGTLCGLLGTLLPMLPPLPLAIVSGFVEFSGGLLLLPTQPRGVCFVLSAVLLAWGGLCVHFQGISALHEVGLPARPYLQAKLIQAAIAGILAAPTALLLFP